MSREGRSRRRNSCPEGSAPLTAPPELPPIPRQLSPPQQPSPPLSRLEAKAESLVVDSGIKKRLSPQSQAYLDRCWRQALVLRAQRSRPATRCCSEPAMDKPDRHHADLILSLSGIVPGSTHISGEPTISPILVKRQVMMVVEKAQQMEERVAVAAAELASAMAVNAELTKKYEAFDDLIDLAWREQNQEAASQAKERNQLEQRIDENTTDTLHEASKRREAEAELRSLRSEIYATQVDNARLEAQVSVWPDRLKTLRSDIETLRSTTQKQVVDTEMDLERRRSQNETIRKTIDATNVAAEAKTSQINAVEVHLSRVKAELCSLARQVARYEVRKAGALGIKRDAPQGHVTIVFLDVEDSSALWEAMPDTMTLAAAAEGKIVRASIAGNGGYEVKSDNESFMIAFSSPVSAINFCVEVQEMVNQADWPAKLLQHPSAAVVVGKSGSAVMRGLRLRMGLNSGDPQCVVSQGSGKMDYVGQMVNKAARIAQLANGGSIMCTEDCWREFHEHIDQHRILAVARGQVHLRGIAADETIYELFPRSLSERCADLPEEQLSSDAAKDAADVEAEQLMRRLAAASEGLSPQAAEAYKNQVHRLEDSLQTSRAEFERMRIECAVEENRVDTLRMLRRKLRKHLLPEEAERAEWQQKVALIAHERAAKNIVLDRARSNIRAIIAQHALVMDDIAHAQTDRDRSRSELATLEANMMKNPQLAASTELMDLRIEVRELEGKMLWCLRERASQMERLSAIQTRLQLSDEKAREEEASFWETRRIRYAREADRRARKMRRDMRVIELAQAADLGAVAATGGDALPSIPADLLDPVAPGSADRQKRKRERKKRAAAKKQQQKLQQQQLAGEQEKAKADQDAMQQQGDERKAQDRPATGKKQMKALVRKVIQTEVGKKPAGVDVRPKRGSPSQSRAATPQQDAGKPAAAAKPRSPQQRDRRDKAAADGGKGGKQQGRSSLAQSQTFADEQQEGDGGEPEGAEGGEEEQSSSSSTSTSEDESGEEAEGSEDSCKEALPFDFEELEGEDASFDEETATAVAQDRFKAQSELWKNAFLSDEQQAQAKAAEGAADAKEAGKDKDKGQAERKKEEGPVDRVSAATVTEVEAVLGAQRLQLTNQRMRLALFEARNAKAEVMESISLLENTIATAEGRPLPVRLDSFSVGGVGPAALPATTETPDALERQLAKLTQERDRVQAGIEDLQVQEQRAELREKTVENLETIQRARSAHDRLANSVVERLDAGLPLPDSTLQKQIAEHQQERLATPDKDKDRARRAAQTPAPQGPGPGPGAAAAVAAGTAPQPVQNAARRGSFMAGSSGRPTPLTAVRKSQSSMRSRGSSTSLLGQLPTDPALFDPIAYSLALAGVNNPRSYSRSQLQLVPLAAGGRGTAAAASSSAALADDPAQLLMLRKMQAAPVVAREAAALVEERRKLREAEYHARSIGAQVMSASTFASVAAPPRVASEWSLRAEQLGLLSSLFAGRMVANSDLLAAGVPEHAVYENEYEQDARKERTFEWTRWRSRSSNALVKGSSARQLLPHGGGALSALANVRTSTAQSRGPLRRVGSKVLGSASLVRKQRPAAVSPLTGDPFSFVLVGKSFN
eukprot:m51a1_g7451 putative adenylate cyclase (1605) ;mRNA; f:106354-112478